MSTLQAIAIIVGVVSGVFGLVLGILNYLHQRLTTRPRLVVRTGVLWSDKGKEGYIEIRNVGHVSVMGENTWFQYKADR